MSLTLLKDPMGRSITYQATSNNQLMDHSTMCQATLTTLRYMLLRVRTDKHTALICKSFKTFYTFVCNISRAT